MKTYLKHNAIERAAYDVSSKISLDFIGTRPIKIGAVPRGGIPCLYILMLHLPTYYTMCDDLSQCDIIIDDIVDSGETKKRILELYPKSKFYAFFENSAKNRHDGNHQNPDDNHTINRMP